MFVLQFSPLCKMVLLSISISHSIQLTLLSFMWSILLYPLGSPPHELLKQKRMSRNSRETRVAITYMSIVLHHWLCTYLPVQLLVLQLPNGHCSTYQDYKVSISSTISPVYDFWVNLVVDKVYVPNQINLETIILKKLHILQIQ